MFKEDIEYEVDNLPSEVNGKTFIINQANPNKYTHSYFKYPCKFIPEIPKWAILNFSNPGDIVFDPFAGSGTTLLESILNNRIGLGTEIDQVAKLLIKTKTTKLSTSELLETEQHFNNIINCVNNKRSLSTIPKINNIDHWYNKTNKIQLGKILYYINKIENANIKNFLLTCFVSIVKKTSNADDVSPKPYVSTKIKKKVNLAIEEFSSIYKKYYKEMCDFSTLDINKHAKIINGDALTFSTNDLIDLAVTSPPYINAFDYVRTMRLENLWLETNTEDSLKETKKQYVGTECIKTQYELENLSILDYSDLLKEYYNKIIQKDKKRACVVKKFFEDMLKNLQKVYATLKDKGKYVIVIGNSTIRQIEIESWKVLNEIAQKIGFLYKGVFRYKIKNPYIRIPRKNRGGQVIYDYVLILCKEKKMAQRDRSKEFWLIPKRVSLHQTLCLIDGIVERNYNKTSWNSQKQNNLGVNLKKWGATKDGKNVSPQSIRTLTASLPQYLGFVYINTNTTPNTICITPMGEKLLNYHKPSLVKIPNLVLGKDNIITESEVVLQQMTKLQITNPVILKDCENVFVFPFRLTLKLIKALGYLDREEIAYFLFKTKDESEIDLRIQEITNFRKLSIDERASLINKFRKTHLGNISLVQAPSSAYYEGLCLTTGIIELVKFTPANRDSKITAIRIKKEYLEFVDKILEYNNNVETFNFKDDLELWIEYIGNEDHSKPPFEITLKNFLNEDCLIELKDGSKSIYIDMIETQNQIIIPVFDNVKYQIICSSCDSGKTIFSKEFTFEYKQNPIELIGNTSINNRQVEPTIEELAKRIIEHSNSQNFDTIMLKKLQAINKCFKIDKLQDKNLRGAHYEYLFYKLLSNLKSKNVIDDVFWNGKIGKLGLPVPAPGGKTGTPDIVFKIEDTTYILELTTIKSKSQQFSAELASVPDHIRLFEGNNVIGIFTAPIIHERNTNAMNSILSSYNKKLNCITDIELLKILLSQDRNIIINSLK